MSVLLFFVQKYENPFQCQINFLKSHIWYEKKKFGCSNRKEYPIMKNILMVLQIAWYGIQLTKEIKKFHQWRKKRADDKTPTPNTITEEEAPPSSSDTTITVEKNKDCDININVYPKLDK